MQQVKKPWALLAAAVIKQAVADTKSPNTVIRDNALYFLNESPHRQLYEDLASYCDTAGTPNTYTLYLTERGHKWH